MGVAWAVRVIWDWAGPVYCWGLKVLDPFYGYMFLFLIFFSLVMFGFIFTINVYL